MTDVRRPYARQTNKQVQCRSLIPLVFGRALSIQKKKIRRVNLFRFYTHNKQPLSRLNIEKTNPVELVAVKTNRICNAFHSIAQVAVSIDSSWLETRVYFNSTTESKARDWPALYHIHFLTLITAFDLMDKYVCRCLRAKLHSM